MLKLQGITKDYKVADTKVHALKGVDLEFRSNEFVCILGPSGCGKTTLLNIIGGLDHYTTGDLTIQGKSTKDFSDRDWDVYRNHKIGFIFQSYNLIPHQTVLGNVELALTIAGIGKEERRARATQALERVGLGNELHKRPNQLSGGQMQRVAIARALVNDPAILLADEPTGALDSATSVQIMDLIKEISGERLVVMVTHNPELADEYATRLIRLSDGLVVSDSNPYTQTVEEEKREEVPVQKKTKKKKKERASMSFLTALALSARNLLTKKGRTIVTSIAGSIGIISVCLVLALSNGFSNYMTKTEEDMLSYYPVSVTENAMDLMAIMGKMNETNDLPDMERLDDKVYVDSFLTSLGQGLSVKNNISADYVDYIEKMDRSYYAEIKYGYGVSLSDNLFTKVTTGRSHDAKVEEVRSLSNLKEFYIAELMEVASEYASLVPFADYFGNIVNAMPGTSEIGAEGYGDYVLSQYDVLAGGAFPQNENEVVLVIGSDNQVNDLTLAQLGFIEEPDFLSLFQKGEGTESNEQMSIDFSQIINKEYVLYYNDSVYSKNPDYSEPADLLNPQKYPYSYNGRRAALSATAEEGMTLKITGVLRLKEGLTYGCLAQGLNMTEQTVSRYIAKNQESQIVSWINGHSRTQEVDGKTYTIYANAPTPELEKMYSTAIKQTILGNEVTFYIAYDDSALRYVGGESAPNSINIYAKDFTTKEHLLAYMDAWNDMEGRAEADKITYSDTVGVLMGLMQTLLNAVTYVLVAFTAISLVVSSVMIGIITYVSVVERVKEIGVLRSLGARKRDIRNLFNAETFIIGLSSGVIGVVVTYLLSFLVNAILKPLTGIASLAALPFTSALVMVAISVVLTLISGLIPASAAAKKDPVIALRTE